jgi:hypothetical protein
MVAKQGLPGERSVPMQANVRKTRPGIGFDLISWNRRHTCMLSLMHTLADGLPYSAPLDAMVLKLNRLQQRNGKRRGVISPSKPDDS